MRAALIGKPLGHSYSKQIHERLGYAYDLVEVEEADLKNLLFCEKYGAFNVTIPYKRTVIRYLSEIDETARLIGSVNTVKRVGDRLIGYNTDILGLEYLLRANGISLCQKNVMILGTGGTSLTAVAACERAGAKSVTVVGRSSAVNYENCYSLAKNTQVVINATPVGMYPNEGACPIDIDRLPLLEGVADVIYNPLRTELVLRARAKGLPACGGLQMLVAQAVYASHIFTGEDTKEALIEPITAELKKQMCGVVFIGMPGCGKSTQAKRTAEYLNKKLIDTDALIEQLAGMPIPEIFEKHGEGYFRRIEEQAVELAVKERTAVIATGGGAVLSEKNRKLLKQNSVVIHLRRDISSLSKKGRPLSSSPEKLAALERQRMPIYCDLGDFSIEIDEDKDVTLQKIKEVLG